MGREIRRVARPLDRDARGVQRVVLGIVSERLERAAHPLRLPMEDRRERRLVTGQRRCGSCFEPVEQREVAVAAERLDDVTVGGRALLLERLQQARRGAGVAAERSDLRPQAAEHDVEVARRAEMPAEPADLRAQRRRPVGLDERARGAEERPQAARRHPELVQVLGIVAPARAGIVSEQRPVLGLERDPERLAGRRALPALAGRPRPPPGRARGRASAAARRSSGAGPAQLLLELAQRALVAVEQLDLELAEAAGDVLALEHGDAVVHDLGAAGADPLPAGAQARDGDERRCHGDTPAAGRPARPAAAPAALPARARDGPRPRGSFSCQRPGAVLDAVAERDAVPREPQVRGVVVGGDEDPRRQPLAAELGQDEPLARSQLDLALERLLHRHQA